MPIKGMYYPELDFYLDTEDAIKASLRNPEIYGDPGIVATVLENRGIDHLTMSQLWGFPRLTLLRKLCDYYITMKDAGPALKGTAIHSAVENPAVPDTLEKPICELRVSTVLGKYTIGGQLDIYWPQHKRLVDYKSTSRFPKEPYPNHIAQANGYAWLLRRVKGLDVEEIYITYIDATHKAYRHKAMPVDVWSQEQTEESIQKRLDFLTPHLNDRLLMSSARGCKIYESKWCPFAEFCDEYWDKIYIPEGTVWAKGKMWTPKEWVTESGT